MRPRINIALAALVLAFLSVIVLAQSVGVFTRTGTMTIPRTFHTATLLLDGRVLIMGGVDYTFSFGGFLSSVEVYEPFTGTFTATGNMTTARAGHTATLLPDGRVLIAGGSLNNGFNVPIASAELYDPSTGTFTRTGDMVAAHTFHQATLLANGKVLISGGSGVEGSLPRAELYDPATDTFSATGAYASNISGFNSSQRASSTLLPDGKVLIVWEEHAAELYDPNTGTFTPTGPPSAPSYNDGLPTTTLLMNGKVLVAGGADDDGFHTKAELYDRSTGTLDATGNMAARSEHTATLLPDGTVLLAGGLGTFGEPPPALTSAEIYDPGSGTFSATGTTTVRQDHTATLLNNGQVLVAGGGWPTSTSNAEVYAPSVLVPAPFLLSISGDGQGQGLIVHNATGQPASPDNPATAGEMVQIYCVGLTDGSVIPPQVTIGGRMAEILSFGNPPGWGISQINVRVPSGVVSGSVVPVRLIYLGRTTNEVTIAIQGYVTPQQ
jgi:hypothetical protein